ncbi:bifunctional glycosyltransferase transpeptidase penicillin-binding protein 1A [Companilactobacillus mindensis DSM 14500]|uniref:Bifunctional glycosyltransferase transpeptidase penicillin-binding protein 1A n=1 Tax=Companilactobacillus mindensis DSM 14500 TaxID=1423770 RepID=A0A0R1QM39_9LACO|nr:PBP1A family penicillin-binding protein [Companilactobacillus mindensis]KRL45839.1 bifunctional glycosyltransferase transpeptidase penicillin-binding protein 1A [Companilactobacillus mindensis DSM 14500]GEO77699.1 penicillin-binding protein 1A [Companilactobacillus mindensis]
MNNKNNNIFTFKNIFKWIVSILAVLVGIFLFIFVYYAFSAPTVSQENLQSGGSSTIVDSSGKQIASLGDNKRNYVTIDKVPQTMEDAVVSIEDKNFYNEPLGIDPVRIAKSAVNNITKGTLQGGSTLTQQLVKLTVFSTDSKDQTFKRKMQEAWLAMRVSQKFSKQQILEFYINKVYLNNGIYGMETGAKYYYGKTLKQLTLPEMAMLAGLPNAPSNYDPYAHPAEAKQRRDLVINAMYNNNKITKAQADAAINTPITTGLQPYKKVTNSNNNKRIISDPYIKEAITEVKKKGFDPYRDNLKITVNMDYDAQKRLYNIVNTSNYVQFPDSKMQVGASIVNPNNGKVVAMIGGRNLSDIQFGLNRAVQTTRSNGSTMKPILDYGPAIEYLNWSTYHQVEDTPYTYAGTDIALKDWDEQYEGQMSMRDALVNSRNIPAIRTLSAVGFSKAKQFASGLGISSDKMKVLSNGIGTEVSTLQGASAYSAFSNGGTYYKPYFVSKIETADGLIHNYSKSGKKVMKQSTAYMLTDMLKGVPASYATYANISGLHQAGKTGTTNYDDSAIASNSALSGTAKDSWYNGYTKNYSISVWTGYDSPNEKGISSTYQSVAGKIYKAEMSYLASQTNSNPNWKRPSSVIPMMIKKDGSTTPVVASPSSSSSTYTKELFVKGHAPSNPYKISDYSSSSASGSSSNEVTTNRHSSSSSESNDEENDTTTDSDETGTGTTDKDTETNSNTNSTNNSTETNNSDSGTSTNTNNGNSSSSSNGNSNTGGNTNTGNTGNTGGTTGGGNTNTGGSTGSNGGTTGGNTGGSTTNGGGNATTNGSSTTTE